MGSLCTQLAHWSYQWSLQLVSNTEYTQSGNCRSLACIPSWWKNQPCLVRLEGARPHPFTLIPSHIKLQCTLQRADTLAVFLLHPICTLWFLNPSCQSTAGRSPWRRAGWEGGWLGAWHWARWRERWGRGRGRSRSACQTSAWRGSTWWQPGAPAPAPLLSAACQQAFPFTSIPVYKHFLLQAFPFTSISVYKRSPFTSIPVYKHFRLQAFPFTSIPIYKHFRLQAFPFTSIPVYKHSRLQAFPFTSIPVYKHSHLQAFQLTSIPVYKHSHLQAFPFTSKSRLQAYPFTSIPGHHCETVYEYRLWMFFKFETSTHNTVCTNR